MKITKEMLYGWITTKMNGWEKPIYKLINDIRNSEVNIQKKINNIQAILIALVNVSGHIIVIGMFLPAFYVYGHISTAELLAVLGFMAGIGFVMHIFMYYFTCIIPTVWLYVL